jgi:hypothetical protein
VPAVDHVVKKPAAEQVASEESEDEGNEGEDA